MSAPKPEDIEAILLHHFPWKGWADQLTAALRPVAISKGDPQMFDQAAKGFPDTAKLETMRARLLAMPAGDVARLATTARAARAASDAAAKAQGEAAAKARAEAKEAKRFYNQPAATADFAFWAKADTWTLDDAVALLLGKDPRIVTGDALSQELQTGTGLMQLGKPPDRSAFHDDYDRLRLLLERSDCLMGSRLKPREVLAWAQRSGAATIPMALAAALPPLLDASGSTQEARAASAAGGDPDLSDAEQPVRGKRSDDNLAAIRAYKAKYGTKATAIKFNISGARVRKLAPSEPEKPEPAQLHEVWGRKKP